MIGFQSGINDENKSYRYSESHDNGLGREIAITLGQSESQSGKFLEA